MKYSRIAGTGSRLPDKVVTNHDLEKTIETNDQWIRDRTGICERRVAVDGETTAHYIAERLEPTGVKVTRLAHGVPVGGELDYLDDGTLTAALKARRAVAAQTS